MTRAIRSAQLAIIVLAGGACVAVTSPAPINQAAV